MELKWEDDFTVWKVSGTVTEFYELKLAVTALTIVQLGMDSEEDFYIDMENLDYGTDYFKKLFRQLADMRREHVMQKLNDIIDTETKRG